MTHTRIATSDASTITVRGRDLVNDLVGQFTFTEMTYFLVTGQRPTSQQARVLDACLVTLAEHGLTPGALATRLIADSVPGEVQVAVAGGLLTVGSVFAGTMEGCASILLHAAEDADPPEHFRRVIADHRARRSALPGFGHAYHKPDDPRTPRLLAVARENGCAARYVPLLELFSRQIDAAYGKHLTINATGAIGALLLEIGIGPDIARGIAVVSRSAGLLGHILEEHETGSAREIAKAARNAIPYGERAKS